MSTRDRESKHPVTLPGGESVTKSLEYGPIRPTTHPPTCDPGTRAEEKETLNKALLQSSAIGLVVRATV